MRVSIEDVGVLYTLLMVVAQPGPQNNLPRPFRRLIKRAANKLTGGSNIKKRDLAIYLQVLEMYMQSIVVEAIDATGDVLDELSQRSAWVEHLVLQVGRYAFN